MSDLTIQERAERVEKFHFRDFHPNVRFGTASDRYAGWIGQIYPREYTSRVTTRSRRLGRKTYPESKVPVESVADYFRHFEVLEIDFTFYRPLLEEDGSPTTNYAALQRYADCAPDNAIFFLKAPQAFFARKLRRTMEGRTSYVDNPDFLNGEACAQTFIHPAMEMLGDRIAGIIYEQEYQRVADAPDADENVAELDAFFNRLPDIVQPHIEIRSPHLLEPVYFDWLQSAGIGFVFSHWTWLPPIRKQWALSGQRFSATDLQVVARLLTPLDVPYAEAYARTHPFDRVIPEIAGSDQGQRMVLDTVALAFRAEDQGATLNVITNNRAWGNAPALTQTIARRILEEEGKRAGQDQERP